MKALLLHDIVPHDRFARALRRAGHDVVRCAPDGSEAFPCVGVAGRCPLDGTVDVAVVVHDRPTTDIGPGEAGVICALRDGIPVVVAGNGARSPFREQASAVAASVADVGAACERAVETRAARLGRVAGGTVQIDGDRATIVLPAGSTAAAAVLAHQRVARCGPGSRIIDVGIDPF